MSELKPCPCAKCGNLPEVIDRRIRFVVICECQEPFNYAIGSSVGFLDHIVDDESAQVAFDAVNVKELRESAIESWNINQQLTTITKQRDELINTITEQEKVISELVDKIQLNTEILKAIMVRGHLQASDYHAISCAIKNNQLLITKHKQSKGERDEN